MESTPFLTTACVILAITSLGGLVMFGMRIAGKPHPPTWFAMAHGLLAGAALTLLLYAYFTVGLPSLAVWALLLFVLAAAGGTYLNLNYHWKKLPLPMGIIIGHAGAAVVGFVLLLAATWAAMRP